MKLDLGYTKVKSFDAQTKIHGIFLYTGNKLIVHCGTKLYLSGTNPTVLYSSMANNESQMYMFGNNLYINDGTNYLQYDGTTLSTVASHAYVPTTSIGRSPARRWHNV